MDPHTCTYVHSCQHTQVLTHTHRVCTQLRISIPTCEYKCMHMCTATHRIVYERTLCHIFTHTHIHECSFKHTRSCTHIFGCPLMGVHSCMRTCVLALVNPRFFMHTYVHSYRSMHTPPCIHKHTHIHICTQPLSSERAHGIHIYMLTHLCMLGTNVST